MNQTCFLKTILARAEKIRSDFGDADLCASHVAGAFVWHWDQPYTGFCDTDPFLRPVRFEEERVRYIFREEIKIIGFFKNELAKQKDKKGEENSFDFSFCERIAVLRGSDTLSADVVLLCALNQLDGKCKLAVRGAKSENEILDRLADTDTNVYAYMLKLLQDIKARLEAKCAEVEYERKKKNAEPFLEPEELAAMLYQDVETKVLDRSMQLKVPKFFGKADLKLTIHQADGCWYVHDNGCAIRHLKKRLGDDKKTESVLKKVCHSRLIDQGRIVGNFTTGRRFFFYLQKLIFVAHADLYYTKAEKPLYIKDPCEVYRSPDFAEPLDSGKLLNELKDSISFSDHDGYGVSVSPATSFSNFSTRAAFWLEPPQNGKIYIRDQRKGNVEGEIFEAFYWSNDDLSLYTDFIQKIAQRFGAEFDGTELCLSVTRENVLAGLYKFFNLAVLLSELGHDIALPKLRQRREI